MSRNKVRAFSGAADEIGFHFGVLEKSIKNKEKFVAEHGISSGAIIQFVRMCGDMEKARELVLSFSLKDHIFGHKIIGYSGIRKAVSSLIRNKPYLWEYNKLKDTIKSVTSVARWGWYKGPETFIGVCDENGDYHDIRIDNLSYEDALDVVLQSCVIPNIVKPIKGGFDGGLVNHIGSEFLSNKYRDCDVVSVFARTKEWSNRKPSKSFVKGDFWVRQRLLFRLSEANEKQTSYRCVLNKVDHIAHFMDVDVIKGMFQIKKGDHYMLYQMGLKSIPLILTTN